MKGIIEYIKSNKKPFIAGLLVCGCILNITLAVIAFGATPNQEQSDNTTMTVPLSDYIELKYQYDQLVNQITAYQAIYSDNIKRLQKDNESLINQALQYRQDYINLSSRVKDAETRLTSQVKKAIHDANSLSQELALAKQEIEVLNKHYKDAVERVIACTPRDFTSLDELKEWRIEQRDFGDNTIANCREMQRRAWESGYILSVRRNVPGCRAFIGDKVYKVLPAYDVEKEDDEDFVCVWKVG